MTPERKAYMKSVSQMLATGVELLESEGKTVNSLDFKRAAFGGYRPRRQDIIVSTYPKSGTNWIMNICQEIAWDGEAEFEHVNSAIPWPDSTMKTPVATLADLSMAERSVAGLRVIKSHLEAAFVPFSKHAKYIVIVRDPKDALISAYHFENRFFDMMVGGRVPLNSFIDGFLAKRFIYINWADHTAGWWALRNRPNIMCLFFEEMKDDLPGIVQRTADFLEVTLSAEAFDKVVEKGSYRYMKKNDHKFSPPTPSDYPKQGRINMIRSGQIGESINSLTHDQRLKIDQFCCAELQRHGSDFPYSKYYQ